MKTYHGYRDQTGSAHVDVDGRPLRLRLDLDSHSPTGFEWDYSGSGPAQLSLAILADAFRNDHLAKRLHQPFKWKVISRLDHDHEWTMSCEAVRKAAVELLAR